MADLLLEVPKHIEHRLDDLLVSRVGRLWQQEEQVDVRAGGEQTASVPSNGEDGQPRRGLDARVNEPPRHIVQRANELILEIAQPLGAAASAPALLERLSRLGAALIEHGAEEIDGGEIETPGRRPASRA